MRIFLTYKIFYIFLFLILCFLNLYFNIINIKRMKVSIAVDENLDQLINIQLNKCFLKSLKNLEFLCVSNKGNLPILSILSTSFIFRYYLILARHYAQVMEYSVSCTILYVLSKPILLYINSSIVFNY